MTDQTDTPRHAPLAGVIGWPIAHSRSPRLHGHWLARHGIAGHYVPLPVAPEHLAEVLRAMPRMGFVGCNVTIPHKESVLALADVVTDRAALIGRQPLRVGIKPDGVAEHGEKDEEGEHDPADPKARGGFEPSPDQLRPGRRTRPLGDDLGVRSG